MSAPDPSPPASRRRSILRFVALLALAFVLSMALVAFVWLAPRWKHATQQAQQLVDSHQRFEVSHPGWSFPARVWSDAAPLDQPDRLLEHAKLRGYTEQCPAVDPGTWCPDPVAAVPRGGVFPEGIQPAGVEGWNRPLALEPVPIGTFIGPDAEIRWHLPIDDAPPHLIEAIIASEDGNFYEHTGVDFKGIVRAVWANLRGGRYGQGASTLTMQVVRNLTGRKEKTLTRKLDEALLAMAVEAYAGKEAILQFYLDAPYLGQSGNLSICGFQAASQHYWGIDAGDLTIAQAATLASILPAPGRYAPDRDPALAQTRRDRVLDAMAERGFDIGDAKSTALTTQLTPLPTERHPGFLSVVRQELFQKVPNEIGYGAGLMVFTSLDLVAQTRTEQVAAKEIPKLQQMLPRTTEQPLEAAMPLLNAQTGHLVAVWGGNMQTSVDFNRATQAKRQAGSAFKPLVYAMAFQKEADGKPVFTAASTMPNEPRTFPNTGGWRPRNVGGKYTPTATLAYGLAWSQNIATASLLEELGGPEQLVSLADSLGFDTESYPREMGLALGQAEVFPVELARFVGTVIRDGQSAHGSAIIAVLDASGHPRLTASEAIPLMDPDAAVLTRGLMRLVVDAGTGGAARGAGGALGFMGPAIGKTGTTDAEKDLWFVGGTPHYAGAVWLGYDQPERLGASASDLAAPLWGWWMRAVHEGIPHADFTIDKERFVRRGVCTITGLRAGEQCKVLYPLFAKGSQPYATCEEEHPAPEPRLDADGNPAKPFEGLWKRKQREAEEAGRDSP